jgi:glyoxylase-like metal-dependent hydrolase (beta-lactamase superfamily II)
MLEIRGLYESATSTVTYVIWHKSSRDAIVIDPVWDFDPQGGVLTETSYQLVKDIITKEQLKLHYVLETHAHADHISSSQIFKRDFPKVKVAIGEHIREVQKTFRDVFNLGSDFPVDGSQFDQLLKDGEDFHAGEIEISVIALPGHTPACIAYKIKNNLFVGDAIFMPDQGTGRCDFPAGSAETLYQSVAEKLYKLPDDTKIFVGHDYQPGGRAVAFETTVGNEKSSNIQLKSHTNKEEFLKFRKERDKTLAAPRLLFPSVLVNIAAGHLPKAESNGKVFLKIPISIR